MSRAEVSKDVAIIGAGTAALAARRTVKKAGGSVVMIDAGPLGTTCARVGCMPSKLLIAAASRAHDARHSDQLGVKCDVSVDGPAVFHRLRAERDRFVGFVRRSLDEARDAGELIEGRASIVEKGKLKVDNGTSVRFGRLIVATGAKPSMPPPYRGLEDLVLTNENVFELGDLPKSLLVVGLGVAGLELGQAFARLGTRVTLIGVEGALGPLTDPAVKKRAKEIFEQELDSHPTHKLDTVERDGDQVRAVFFDCHGRRRDDRFERILMAAGRTPRLDGLGLEQLGLRADSHGRFAVDPLTLQLEDAPVFLAGDANALHPVLHEASDDGKIAGRNAMSFPEVHASPRRTPLSIVFSEPQIGIVGGGFAALREGEAVAGEVDFSNQGRARVAAEAKGLARIYAAKDTGILLGAELIGPQAEHLAHLLAWAVQRRLTVDSVLALPFYHPVVEEGLRTALYDLAAALRHGEPISCSVSSFGPGC